MRGDDVWSMYFYLVGEHWCLSNVECLVVFV